MPRKGSVVVVEFKKKRTQANYVEARMWTVFRNH